MNSILALILTFSILGCSHAPPPQPPSSPPAPVVTSTPSPPKDPVPKWRGKISRADHSAPVKVFADGTCQVGLLDLPKMMTKPEYESLHVDGPVMSVGFKRVARILTTAKGNREAPVNAMFGALHLKLDLDAPKHVVRIISPPAPRPQPRPRVAARPLLPKDYTSEQGGDPSFSVHRLESDDSYSSTEPSIRGVGGFGPVYVRGYTRKNGTYVSPHYRGRASHK
jgi:hypothetical protein